MAARWRSRQLGNAAFTWRRAGASHSRWRAGVYRQPSARRLDRAFRDGGASGRKRLSATRCIQVSNLLDRVSSAAPRQRARTLLRDILGFGPIAQHTTRRRRPFSANAGARAPRQRAHRPPALRTSSASGSIMRALRPSRSVSGCREKSAPVRSHRPRPHRRDCDPAGQTRDWYSARLMRPSWLASTRAQPRLGSPPRQSAALWCARLARDSHHDQRRGARTLRPRANCASARVIEPSWFCVSRLQQRQRRRLVLSERGAPINAAASAILPISSVISVVCPLTAAGRSVADDLRRKSRAHRGLGGAARFNSSPLETPASATRLPIGGLYARFEAEIA